MANEQYLNQSYPSNNGDYQPNSVLDSDLEEDKQSLERTVKVLSVGLGIVFLISLVVIKIFNKDFPLTTLLIIGFSVIALFTLIFFSFDIYRRFSQREDEEFSKYGRLPDPLSHAELRRIAKNYLNDETYANLLQSPIEERFYHEGKPIKQRIYCYVAPLEYKKPEMSEGIAYILINSHFPNDLRTVLFDPSPYDLAMAIRGLSSTTEEVDTEERIEEDPLSGRKVTSRRSVRRQENNIKNLQRGDLE